MVYNVVFLGAGFNTPFCPDNTGLLIAFRKQYPQYSTTIDEVEGQLTKSGLRVDLETVYTALKARSNPDIALKMAGAWMVGILGVRSLPVSDNAIEQLLIDFDGFLIDQFFIEDKAKFARIANFYASSFKRLGEYLSSGYHEYPFDFTGILDIFTTNYDNIIEIYAREHKIPFCDGYRPDSAGSDFLVFDRGLYETNNFRIRLFKLHGSVTLYELESGEIIRGQTKLKKGSVVAGEKVVRNVMIFPVQEKYVSKEPYRSMDSLLRTRLLSANTCLVLCHSLSDEAILNAFIDSATENKNLKIVLMSRDPISLSSKFPKEIWNRILRFKADVSEAGFPLGAVG